MRSTMPDISGRSVQIIAASPPGPSGTSIRAIARKRTPRLPGHGPGSGVPDRRTLLDERASRLVDVAGRDGEDLGAVLEMDRSLDTRRVDVRVHDLFRHHDAERAVRTDG